MRDGSEFYSQTINRLDVVIGESCEDGEVQIVFDLDVEVTLEVHVEHDGNYVCYSHVDVDDIQVLKVHDITICDNQIEETAHVGLQKWLERDFKANSTNVSYLLAAVEEYGLDHHEMDRVEDDHPDI